MRHGRILATLTLLSILLFARDSARADWNPFSRERNPLAKLGRGMTNLWFSPLEYGVNLQKVSDRKGPGSGIFEGLVSGSFYSALRIISGLYDIVTFPIPIPWDYKPVMWPEYVFYAAKEA